jgi:NhaA family Na+:H+ antiporter
VRDNRRTSSTATITPTLEGWVGVSATSAQTSLATLTPAFGTKTFTATGLTVSLLIAELSYESTPALMADAKVGILAASIIASLCAVIALRVRA